jgi:regulatory protein
MVAATGRIASIEAHPKRRKHFTLGLTHGEELTVHEDVIVALGLRVGTVIEAGLLEQVQHETELTAALEAAIRQLGTRPRSRREIEQALRRKGYGPETVAQVVAKLQTLGYINDEQYARELVGSLLRRRVTGRRGLVYRLRQSGLGSEAAARVVGEALEGVDETARAQSALEAQLRRWGEADDPRKLRSKAWQYLARQGYDSAVIADALSAALPGETD